MPKCFYCQVESPNVRRCSRCRLVTYCSKQCQAASWKATHKNSCKPHPSLFGEDGSEKPEPDVLSEDWIELQLDKQLSKWLDLWRSVFCMYTIICLDLANHPPERVLTHCLVIRVRPSPYFDPKKSKMFEAFAAIVETRETIEEKFPQLAPIVADPTDLTRPRFLVVLENHEGYIRRVRMNQWNDLNLRKWRNIPKETSRKLAEDGPRILVDCVNTMEPEEMEMRIGRR